MIRDFSEFFSKKSILLVNILSGLFENHTKTLHSAWVKLYMNLVV